ncbi:MAG: hypothetical protein AAGI34_03535 [Pseudomonadota bacterium]
MTATATDAPRAFATTYPGTQAGIQASAPALNIVLAVLLSGAAATIAFDFFGQVLSPTAGFARLAPVGLASAVWNTLGLGEWKQAGHALHYMAGIIGYPLGWALIAGPLFRAVVPGLHWLVASALYGVALWVLALFVLAHLIAGMPAFLGFTGITWVALVGHVVFGVVAAGTLRALGHD